MSAVGSYGFTAQLPDRRTGGQADMLRGGEAETPAESHCREHGPQPTKIQLTRAIIATLRPKDPAQAPDSAATQKNTATAKLK